MATNITKEILMFSLKALPILAHLRLMNISSKLQSACLILFSITFQKYSEPICNKQKHIDFYFPDCENGLY